MTTPTPEAVAELCARLRRTRTIALSIVADDDEAAAAMLEALSRALAELTGDDRHLMADGRAERLDAELAAALRERNQALDQCTALHAELAAARKVPREPTAKMVQAFINVSEAAPSTKDEVRKIWRAMYDAARREPKP